MHRSAAYTALVFVFSFAACEVAITAAMGASTNSKEVRWMQAASGFVPSGALIAGAEPNRLPLYLCRAEFQGGLHPGKLVAKNCNIGFGGSEVLLPEYEILLAPDASVDWVAASEGQIPRYSLPAGREPGRPVLYACRGAHRSGVHPGKLVAANCNISWGGLEILLEEYEVLTVPPRWVVGSDGSIPDGALSGGWEVDRPDLFVCRGEYRGGLHPGKLIADSCSIGWGGHEVQILVYEVLVAPAELAKWTSASDGDIPAGSFVGGGEPDRPELYVCRGEHRGGVHPGKLVGRYCDIGWGSTEVLLSDYEVLVFD